MTKRSHHDLAELYALDAAPAHTALDYAQQRHVVEQIEEITALVKRLRARLCPDWTLLPLELWVAILSKRNSSSLLRQSARGVCRLFRDAVDMSRGVALLRYSFDTCKTMVRNVHTLVACEPVDGVAVLSLPRLRNLCVSHIDLPPAYTALHCSLDELRLDCRRYTDEVGTETLFRLINACAMVQRLVVETADPISLTVLRLAKLVKRTGCAGVASIALLTRSSHNAPANVSMEEISGVFNELFVVDKSCVRRCLMCQCWQSGILAELRPSHVYSAVERERANSGDVSRWVRSAVGEELFDVSLHFVDNDRRYALHSGPYRLAHATRKRTAAQQDFYDGRLARIRRSCDKAVRAQSPLVVRAVDVCAVNDMRGHPFAFPMSIPLPPAKPSL